MIWLSSNQVTDLYDHFIADGQLIRPKFRDLEAALNAPLASFDGREFYESLVGKVGKLIEGIPRAHAYTDGNKRLAWLVGVTTLGINGVNLKTIRPETAANEVIKTVTRESEDGDLAIWLARHIAD